MYACARLTTLPTLALHPVCSAITPDRQPNAITTKRAVSKLPASELSPNFGDGLKDQAAAWA